MTIDICNGLDSAQMLPQKRTGLVRVTRGVDASLFGGWGVRI